MHAIFWRCFFPIFQGNTFGFIKWSHRHIQYFLYFLQSRQTVCNLDAEWKRLVSCRREWNECVVKLDWRVHLSSALMSCILIMRMQGSAPCGPSYLSLADLMNTLQGPSLICTFTHTSYRFYSKYRVSVCWRFHSESCIHLGWNKLGEGKAAGVFFTQMDRADIVSGTVYCILCKSKVCMWSVKSSRLKNVYDTP